MNKDLNSINELEIINEFKNEINKLKTEISKNNVPVNQHDLLVKSTDIFNGILDENLKLLFGDNFLKYKQEIDLRLFPARRNIEIEFGVFINNHNNKFY